MFTYCFPYRVLKLYVHYNINIIGLFTGEQQLLPNTAGKKELYGSNTCLNICVNMSFAALVPFEKSTRILLKKNANFTLTLAY